MSGQLIRALDRQSPLPLWAQLLEQLRWRLAQGEFVERFPTDRELMRDYAVSRQTVREAVRRLADEGLVRRERGRGTRVRSRTFEQTAGTLESLFEYIEAEGHEQTSITREAAERRDAAASRVLGLPPRTPLVYIERLRLVDGEPLALDRSWLPAEIARPLLDIDLARTGIYVELGARCGVTLSSGSERVRPVVPDRDDRRSLASPPGAAAFHVSRLTRTSQGPVEWRESIIRGDRWSILVELTPTVRGASVLPWGPLAA
jgi:GntR family transcriptional regulator